MPGRVYSREFKLTVVRQIAHGEKRPAQVCVRAQVVASQLVLVGSHGLSVALRANTKVSRQSVHKWMRFAATYVNRDLQTSDDDQAQIESFSAGIKLLRQPASERAAAYEKRREVGGKVRGLGVREALKLLAMPQSHRCVGGVQETEHAVTHSADDTMTTNPSVDAETYEMLVASPKRPLRGLRHR